MRLVILFGNSIILGTVGASLAASGEVEVVVLSPPYPSAAGLAALAPDALLFDLQSGAPPEAFSLLATCPDLLLVGVNPDCNVVTLWSSRQFAELSMQELVQSIVCPQAGAAG
jgi:hypothetical protein